MVDFWVIVISRMRLNLMTATQEKDGTSIFLFKDHFAAFKITRGHGSNIIRVRDIANGRTMRVFIETNIRFNGSTNI